MQRLKARDANKTDVVRVTIRCPVFPLILDELLEIPGQPQEPAE